MVRIQPPQPVYTQGCPSLPRICLRFENAPPALDPRALAGALEADDLASGGQDLTATVRFVLPGEMASLNRRHHGGQGPTNVLTFTYGKSADIAICRQVAAADARVRGWDLPSELAYLCVHGCLHALGFEHGDRHRREEMESAERRILARMGIKTCVLES